MSENVVSLFGDKETGSFLCMVELWRLPDRSIQARLNTMDGKLIETTGHDVPSRVEIVSDWMLEGAANMAEQSQKWLNELTPLQK